MVQPPLYIRLTNAETGEKFNYLLTLCHTFTEDARGFTVITTFHASNAGVATVHLSVKETEQVIFLKMEKVVRNFYRMMTKSAKKLMDDETETWRKGLDDDEDPPEDGENFYA